MALARKLPLFRARSGIALNSAPKSSPASGLHSMQPTRLSRPFLLLLVVAFSLVVTFAVRLTHVLGGFSREGADLTRSIRATSRLNEELRNGIGRQVSLVRRQLDAIDASFPEEFRVLDHAVRQTQMEYLKLYIGKQEKQSIERIKAIR